MEQVNGTEWVPLDIPVLKRLSDGSAEIMVTNFGVCVFSTIHTIIVIVH